MGMISWILDPFYAFFGVKPKVDQKKEINKERPKKIKLDTDVDGFKSIDMFNTDSYIQDTFEQLFHAIKVDAWSCNFSYNEMEFKKDSVTLKIEFSAYGNFKIKRIILTSGYNNYYYRSDLDSEVYQFFYEVYSKSITKQNDDLKKMTDDSLVKINKVLGRDTIRDSKIDWLLNGEE
jgi:hypothetical protein